MARVLAVVLYQLCILPSVFALAGLFRVGQLNSEASSASGTSSGAMEAHKAIEASPATTFRCVGAPENRSCLFRNLYYANGRFVMYVTDKPKEEDIRLYRADKYDGTWHAHIEKFANEEAIADHLEKHDLIEESGLSVQFNPLFHQNIGHALFDGLYPAFLATLKLGVQDQPWRPVVAVDPGCFDGPDVGGQLKSGDIVETYVPHAKYKRSLRPVRAKVIRAPQSQLGEDQCDWKAGLDHTGLVLGATGAGNGDRASCFRDCSQSFHCKAVVLFGGICYLKTEGGSKFPSPGRELCILKGSSTPKQNIVVTPVDRQGVELIEMNVSQAWVVGRERPRCMSEGVFEAFGGVGEIRRLFELERDSRNDPNLVVRFEKMVMGVGGAGNLIADKTGAIGGSVAPQSAMGQFRDRMVRAYNLDVKSTSKPLPVNRILNVIVVENKRFNAEDRSALANVIQNLNTQANVRAEFVDWGRIGSAENKFKDHLRKTQEADVYISSIGTALQYVPFLRDGSVYIALGSVWMRSGRQFPTFFEQQLAGGGTPYLRTLYADPGAPLRQQKTSVPYHEDGYYVGVNGTLVLDLMRNADNLLRRGFHIPVPIEDNLSVEAKVLVELCRRDASACAEMNEYRNFREYDCEVLSWNEAVVYEVGAWREGGKCGNSHRKLLRQLRKEYGLPSYGASGI